MSQTLLWVTDPWSTLAHSQDTTLRLIQEASNLGIHSYWSGSDLLLRSVNPDRFLGAILDKNLIDPSNRMIDLDPSKIHQIHYRVDPPVDFNYLSLLEKITQRASHENQIFSPPAILRTQSEKLPPPELKLLSPVNRVVTDTASAQLAFERFKGYSHLVTKPLNEAQSKGVKKWVNPLSYSAWEKIFAIETEAYTHPIMVQEFFPEIALGEIRMWFAAGHFIAAIKKFPKAGDFRVLIDEGSKVEAYHLNAFELKAAAAVGEMLKRQRVALAAIDFIASSKGLKISDYNITSPGLLVQMEQVHGKNFAQEILKKIL